MTTRFSIFETALGTAGIAWNAEGISGVQLPEPEAAQVRARLRRRFPSALEVHEAPPADIEQAIEAIRAHLRGEPSDLSTIRLDMRHVPDFARRVYEVARDVAPGETTSYGELATRLGGIHLARDVGQALARNPFPIVVPCHRVLGAHGKLGGFSARGGVATKQRLLAIERANGTWQLPLAPAPGTD